MDTKKAIILFSNKYSMMNDNGQVNSGVSIGYILSDNLEPVNTSDTQKGYKPCKISLPLDQEKNLMAVPGIYDMDLNIVVDKDGHPVIRPVAVHFVDKLSFGDTPFDKKAIK